MSGATKWETCRYSNHEGPGLSTYWKKCTWVNAHVVPTVLNWYPSISADDCRNCPCFEPKKEKKP